MIITVNDDPVKPEQKETYFTANHCTENNCIVMRGGIHIPYY